MTDSTKLPQGTPKDFADALKGGFHWRDGWFFKRMDDGSVRISKLAVRVDSIGGKHDKIEAHGTIPPAEWASIVCSVSKGGETRERWLAQQAFHDGTEQPEDEIHVEIDPESSLTVKRSSKPGYRTLTFHDVTPVVKIRLPDNIAASLAHHLGSAEQEAADALDARQPEDAPHDCADEIRRQGSEFQSLPELFGMPGNLHFETKRLVQGFAAALATKLFAAQEKYGYSDGWRATDWMDECRGQLLAHLAKGDPRDVAAYCAFLWWHNESTALSIAQRERSAQQTNSEQSLRQRIEALAAKWDRDPALTSSGQTLVFCASELREALKS